MKQETRQVVTAVLAYGSWTAAALLAFLRATEHLPTQFAMTIVLCIGVAMAAGIKLSRMRLTQTMLDVYRAGVETARVQKQERDEMETRIMHAQEERDSA